MLEERCVGVFLETLQSRAAASNAHSQPTFRVVRVKMQMGCPHCVTHVRKLQVAFSGFRRDNREEKLNLFPSFRVFQLCFPVGRIGNIELRLI